MPGQWVAKSCGSKEKHGQHIHVMDGQAYACFGYSPINLPPTHTVIMIRGAHCQECGSTDYEDIMYTEEFEGYSTCCNQIVVGRCMKGVCYHE